MYKSSIKGTISSLFNIALLLTIFITGAIVVHNWQTNEYKRVLPKACAEQGQEETIQQYESRMDKDCTRRHYDRSYGIRDKQEFIMFASYFLFWILCLLAVLTSTDLVSIMYGGFSTYRFIKDPKNEDKLDRITKTTYKFINTKHIKTSPVDRIMQIDLSQNWLDRILNTGSVKISFAKFKNADSESETCDITCKCLDNPESLFEELKALKMKHEGFLLRQTEEA